MVEPSLFTISAALADVPLKKCVAPPKTLLILVIRLVLELTTLKMPSLKTSPTMLPAAARVPSCKVEQEQMNVPPV